MFSYTCTSDLLSKKCLVCTFHNCHERIKGHTIYHDDIINVPMLNNVRDFDQYCYLG